MGSERAPAWDTRRLVERLGDVLGGPNQARMLVDEGLRAAGRDALPTDPNALFAFVRGYLAEKLVAHLGPRLAMTLLDDFRALAVAQSSAPPAARDPISSRAPNKFGVRPKVVIIDGDRFARASLARSLMQFGCDVIVVDAGSEEEEKEEKLNMAVVFVRARGSLLESVRALARLRPRPVILALVSTGVPDAERLLRSLGFERWLVLPLTTPTAKVRELVAQLTA